MKSFFSMFTESAREFTRVRSMCVTAVFIAVSMVLELFSIDIGFAKINFAFLAIAVIGMLFGPTVGFAAGLACDIVGFMVHPTGAFLPIYTLVAGLQGVIYGVCLYPKCNGLASTTATRRGKETDVMLLLRAAIARLLDVVIINLVLNTALNLHYGFIPQESLHVAIGMRLAKNLGCLVADLPILFVMLPVALAAYQRMGMIGSAQRKA